MTSNIIARVGSVAGIKASIDSTIRAMEITLKASKDEIAAFGSNKDLIVENRMWSRLSVISTETLMKLATRAWDDLLIAYLIELQRTVITGAVKNPSIKLEVCSTRVPGPTVLIARVNSAGVVDRVVMMTLTAYGWGVVNQLIKDGGVGIVDESLDPRFQVPQAETRLVSSVALRNIAVSALAASPPRQP